MNEKSTQPSTSSPLAERPADSPTFQAAIEPDELRMLDLWDAILQNKILLAVFMLGFGVVSAVFAYRMPPVYQAEVLMSPASTDGRQSLAGLSGPVGGLISLAGIGGMGAESLREEALAVLRSRSFTVDFIEDQELLAVLFPSAWDDIAESWRDADTVPTSEDAYLLFDRQIRRVEQDNRTGLVKLAIEWTAPEQAAQWANLLVKRLNDQMRNRAINEAEQNLKYLEEQIELTSVVGVQQALYRLAEVELEKSMLANARREFAFRVIDPAVPPDMDRYVKPKRLFIVVAGLLLGTILGGLIATVRTLARRLAETGDSRAR